MRWALRVAPSSGNLQTTEVHLVLPPLDWLAPLTAAQLGSSAGFSECPMEIEMLGPSPTDARYHYQPEMHRLELRLEAPEE